MLSKELFIKNLDLGYLEKRLVDKDQWSLKDAKETVRRYKNFLTLHYKYPKVTIAPAPDIDEAWHHHILFTKQYTQETKKIFGSYLHHTPATGSSKNEKRIMEQAMQTAAELYYKEFGELYFTDLDVSSFW